MKYIKKDKPPQSLVSHIMTPHHTYDNYSKKDDLRKYLLAEQGFLCCYCMRKIQSPTEDKMKIEHFKPQNNTNRDLDYTNLLGACKGNEGSPPHLQHCDTAKAKQEITISPLNEKLMEQIKFTSRGEVFVEENIYNDEMNKVLNLNVSFLRREREAILEAIKQKINKRFGKGRPSKNFIKEELKLWESKNDGRIAGFCQVAIYYLKKELKRAI